MNKDVQEFHDYVVNDVMANITGISSKRMFGGFSLYLEGAIFAMITSESELYFKVDETLKEEFEKYGSHPFVYSGHKNKGPVEMPYWLLPEEIMNNEDELADWIQTSAAVSKK